jgi:hypothetical protein
VRADGTQYAGSGTTSGNALSGGFEGYPPFGQTFADGSTHGAGTLSGTVSEHSSITASYNFTTDNGTATSGTISLTFDPSYNSASSLATVTGTYSDGNGGMVTVDASGAITGSNPNSGCTVNGSVAIADATYDVYTVSTTYSGCVGIYAALNGITLTGLAAPDLSVNPVQVFAATTSAGFALAYTLTMQ